MKIIMRKFGCFKNFLLYLETLLHITRLVYVIRKKLMSESSQNSTQILLDGKNGSPNSKQHHMVCKLKKSIYGLKQSARCWNITLDHYLKESGFVQNPADPCVYCKTENKNGKKCLVIIAVYVDDTILAANDVELLQAEKNELSKRFEMEDLGEIHYCLGMTIKRDRNAKVMMIHQKSYLEAVLKKFGMQHCKPISTPMDPNAKFEKLTDDD